MDSHQADQADQADLSDLAVALATARAHPCDPSASEGVRALQTHISNLFLTRERVYKLRKAVAFSFLDFRTRERRNADCLRELGLNRRLAPDVYLGVAPLLRGSDGWELGPVGEELVQEQGRALEHCVVMRRLPDGRDAQSLLEASRLTTGQIDRLAIRIAAFHRSARLAAPAPFSRWAWLACVEDPVLENCRILREHYAGRRESQFAAELEESTRSFLRRHAEHFERRRCEGRAVDGHGDLQLQHVWFEDPQSEPLVIDCVEFNDSFRRIDAASDIAFLAMDLRYRGGDALAERLLRGYARESDDFDLYFVDAYYESYRSAVRSKVAALAAADPAIDRRQRRAAEDSAGRHLELAAKLLDNTRRGALILLCGLVGTGKSSVAEVLADAAGGVVVASDRTRKTMAGLDPEARPMPGMDLYAPARVAAVYEALLERAEPIVHSGRIAILDATYARAEERRRVRDWSRAHGTSVHLVETRCPAELAIQRLASREAQGHDPSDAGPQLYWQRAGEFEACQEWPGGERTIVETGEANWPDDVRRLAKLLSAGRVAGSCAASHSSPD